MLTEIEKVLPSEIEKRSFEIIAEELGDKQLIPGTESIVKRCIHTSADFDYADNLCFSEHAVAKRHRGDPGGSLHCDGYADGKIRHQQKRCLRATAVKRSALCQTKMLRQEQKKPEAPARQPAWKKRRSWIKS